MERSALARDRRRAVMIRKLAIVTLALMLVAVPVWAEEVSGKIQKVDSADRSIVLEDGTQLWLAESVSADQLKEGATVKASYEEKDGKKVVTEIQVSQ
jgi:ferric-dicitrate binding protein FerR (iron transport regulator)